MKLVVILNVNPDKNIKTKISNNREYTRRELKTILSEGFSGLIDNIIFMIILDISKIMFLII